VHTYCTPCEEARELARNKAAEEWDKRESTWNKSVLYAINQ
jgi:hypothetical protein